MVSKVNSRRTAAGPGASEPARQDSPLHEASTIHSQLLELGKLELGDLRQEWASRWREKAPPIQSADVLLRMIAWRLQCEHFGGPDRSLERRLADLDRRLTSGKDLIAITAKDRVQPGTTLSREWRGRWHRVAVTEGGFLFEGNQYATLSEVARAITGTHWSGPRFFGLEAKQRSRKRAYESGKGNL